MSSIQMLTVGDELVIRGSLWNWGSGANGQLGDTKISFPSTPVTTFAGGTNWAQVSCGNVATAAIKSDGTLWTWGRPQFGELGNGLVGSTVGSTPVTTFAGGTNWRQVSCGGIHKAAIKTDGTLWTWGQCQQLGNGVTTGVRSTPITTFAGGSDWKQVSCGSAHTAAIKTDGTLWLWGTNIGRLGNGQTTNVSTPITTFAGGTNWKQVSAGGVITAAIKSDGTLWIWGETSYGQLGNGSTGANTVSTPVTTFAGGTNWKQVSATLIGGAVTAIKTDGTLWTWGRGFDGRLGNGQTTNVSTPITTFAGGTNWKQVSSVSANIAAIKTDGTLWTWGTGFNGQLGNSEYLSRSTPVTTFAGGNDWRQVSSGNNHMAAIKRNFS